MTLSAKDRIKGIYRCLKIFLNPNTNYVNLLWRTQEQEDDGEPFDEKMERLTTELSALFAKSHDLENEIKKNLKAIGFEVE